MPILQVLTTSNKAIEIYRKYGENEIPSEEMQKKLENTQPI